MNKDVAERLSNRNVLEIISDLERHLQMQPPNGAHIHRRCNMIHTLQLIKSNTRRKYKTAERMKFKLFGKRQKENYLAIINYVDESIRRFGYTF